MQKNEELRLELLVYVLLLKPTRNIEDMFSECFKKVSAQLSDHREVNCSSNIVERKRFGDECSKLQQ